MKPQSKPILAAITIAIIAVIAFALASCSIPPSPAVQAHAAAGSSAFGLQAEQRAQNNFWK